MSHENDTDGLVNHLNGLCESDIKDTESASREYGAVYQGNDPVLRLALWGEVMSVHGQTDLTASAEQALQINRGRQV